MSRLDVNTMRSFMARVLFERTTNRFAAAAAPASTWAARLLGIALLAGSVSAQAATCRVTTSGASGNDGSSWAQAMDLQSALGNVACNEIWVAEGAYKPTTGTDHAATFAIRSDVAVYGGFDGSEDNRDERDPAAHRSVLSGDIGGDDVVDAHGITASATDIVGDNSYHVVSLGDASTATVLDGFTVTGGLDSTDGGGGGGLICSGSDAGQDCSPTLRNLVFRGNAASVAGSGGGGGMLCAGLNQGKCGATLESVTFVGNTAGLGGAMANVAGEGSVATPSLRNVTFIDNSAEMADSAFVNLGAYGGIADSTLTNVTFGGNTIVIASFGTSTSNMTLVNAVLWGSAPDVVFAQGGTMTISHSIVQGGCPVGVTCTDMVAGDPGLGALQDAGGATPVLLPGTGSVALDAGTCTDAPAADQRGIARPQGAGCDVGAVEVRQAQLTVEVNGAGEVGAIVAPALIGAPIADCRQDSGDCNAWYRVEPDAPAILLTVHPDAGNVVQSAIGCGGSLAGSMFTTAALDGDCTLEVVFAPATHTIGGTVTGLAGSGLVLALNGSENLPVAADGMFTFDTMIAGGNPYVVTIGTQPGQPSQACVVINGSGTVGDGDITNVVIHCGAAITYSVGGTLGGLAAGASITLSINGGSELTLAANGAYVFAPRFASGDSYVAAVTSQPPGQHCTLGHAEGTVGSASVTDVDVTCTAGGAQLQLSVTDGGDYARYGQVRDYFVTLGNVGNGPAANIAIGADLDPAFDEANVQWACVGGAPGTACTAQGAGGFADTATLPAGTSLVWIVRVPVRGDSNAAEGLFHAHASGAADASDIDTLVIFRDGVDVPYADGAGIVDPARSEAALEGDDGVAIETEAPAG